MSQKAPSPAGPGPADAGPPDVLGYPLDEALRALESAGWRPTVRTTAPPRSEPAGGLQRVVRQRATGPKELELVVAWERYAPSRRPSPPPSGAQADPA